MYNAYAQYAEEMIIQGVVVKFDFNNKQDAMDCYKLNYKLSPHLTKKELINCLNAKQNFIKNTSNIAVVSLPDISKNTSAIIYYPFLHQMSELK